MIRLASGWMLYTQDVTEDDGVVPDPMMRIQVGPELELPGYGCEDHFLELDTVEHSWECLAVRLQIVRAWKTRA